MTSLSFTVSKTVKLTDKCVVYCESNACCVLSRHLASYEMQHTQYLWSFCDCNQKIKFVNDLLYNLPTSNCVESNLRQTDRRRDEEDAERNA
jgi:hypothetical protein